MFAVDMENVPEMNIANAILFGQERNATNPKPASIFLLLNYQSLARIQLATLVSEKCVPAVLLVAIMNEMEMMMTIMIDLEEGKRNAELVRKNQSRAFPVLGMESVSDMTIVLAHRDGVTLIIQIALCQHLHVLIFLLLNPILVPEMENVFLRTNVSVVLDMLERIVLTTMSFELAQSKELSLRFVLMMILS